MLSWSARRKFLYGGVVFVVALAVILWLGVGLLSHPASCFDTVQNQGETGVDCGGPCATICPAQARAPVVLWQRVFRTSATTYTAAAYIENPNAGAGAGAVAVPYAFRLFDSNNLLVAERDGIIDIPPQETVPVVETGIDVGNRDVAKTFFEFSSDTLVWKKIPATQIPDIRATVETIAPDGTRLTALIENDGGSPIQKLSVAGVLFDASGNAQAASKTIVASLAPGASQEITFTWSSPVPNVVSAEVRPVPTLSPQ